MTRLLHRARSVFETIAIAANAVGTAVIFILVAVMNMDVVARGVFHAPFCGVVEIVIFSMILIVFLQLPDVVRVNRLTRSDGFLAILKDRKPELSRAISRVIDAIACVFMALIAWTMWPEFVEAFESCHFFSQPEFGPPPSGDFWQDLDAAFARCDYFGTPGIMTAPWWPAKLAIFFGVTLCMFLFGTKAILGDRDPELVHVDDNPS